MRERDSLPVGNGTAVGGAINGGGTTTGGLGRDGLGRIVGAEEGLLGALCSDLMCECVCVQN